MNDQEEMTYPIQSYLDEVREIQAELDTLLEAAVTRLEVDLALLAWIIAYEAKPFDLRREANWPSDVEVAFDPGLKWLALRDATLFDLARAQLRSYFSGSPETLRQSYGEQPLALRQERSDETKIYYDFTAEILETERPNPRGMYGDHLARDYLICRILYQGAFGDDLWQLPQADTADVWGQFPAESRAAAHLADLLNSSPALEDLPKNVPSADLIRAVWRKNKKRTDWPPFDG